MKRRNDTLLTHDGSIDVEVEVSEGVALGPSVVSEVIVVAGSLVGSAVGCSLVVTVRSSDEIVVALTDASTELVVVEVISSLEEVLTEVLEVVVFVVIEALDTWTTLSPLLAVTTVGELRATFPEVAVVVVSSSQKNPAPVPTVPKFPLKPACRLQGLLGKEPGNPLLGPSDACPTGAEVLVVVVEVELTPPGKKPPLGKPEKPPGKPL